MAELSSLEKVNMRRTLLYCRNEVAAILGDFVVDVNDEITRQKVVTRIDHLMKTIQSTHSISSYQIICDETLNTEEVVNNKELKVQVIITSKVSLSGANVLPVCLSFTISADPIAESETEPNAPLVTLN